MVTRNLAPEEIVTRTLNNVDRNKKIFKIKCCYEKCLFNIKTVEIYLIFSNQNVHLKHEKEVNCCNMILHNEDFVFSLDEKRFVTS